MTLLKGSRPSAEIRMLQPRTRGKIASCNSHHLDLPTSRPGAGQVGRCTRGGRRQTDLKRDKELLFSQLNANSIYGGEFESDIDRPGETICQRGLARDTCRARMTPHMCINYSGAINAVITRR
jgi:hypothetical protein